MTIYWKTIRRVCLGKMKKFVYIGRIVNTHGIKGELRLLSNFEKKDRVFKPNVSIYIGKEKQKECIESYRSHKEFDMITIEGYTSINEVLKYKGKSVYVEREVLQLQENEYLYDDLIGLFVIEKEKILGKIKEIVYNNTNVLLYVESEKNFYIPLNEEYIKEVDLKKKQVIVEGGENLIL